MSARDRILGRVREALAERKQEAHPGPFGGWRSEGEDSPAVDRFIQLFEAAGGEVVRFDDDAVAAAWVRDFVSKYDAVSMGRLEGPQRSALSRRNWCSSQRILPTPMSAFHWRTEPWLKPARSS